MKSSKSNTKISVATNSFWGILVTTFQPMFTSCSQELLDTAIENVYNFCDFCKALAIRNLWNRNFFEFGDNGPFGCRKVVQTITRRGGVSIVVWNEIKIMFIQSYPLVLANQFGRCYNIVYTFSRWKHNAQNTHLLSFSSSAQCQPTQFSRDCTHKEFW